MHRQVSQRMVHLRDNKCALSGDGVAVQGVAKDGEEREAGAELVAASKAHPVALDVDVAALPRQTTRPLYSPEDEDGRDSRVAEFRGYGSAPMYLGRNTQAFMQNDVELSQGFDPGLTHMSLDALVSPLIAFGEESSNQDGTACGGESSSCSMATSHDVAVPSENSAHHGSDVSGNRMIWVGENDDEVFAFEM